MFVQILISSSFQIEPLSPSPITPPHFLKTSLCPIKAIEENFPPEKNKGSKEVFVLFTIKKVNVEVKRGDTYFLKLGTYQID